MNANFKTEGNTRLGLWKKYNFKKNLKVFKPNI